MTLSELDPDSDDDVPVAKQSEITFKNPDLHDTSEDEFRWEKYEQYDKVVGIRTDVAVNLKEILGEYMWAVYKMESDEDESQIHELVEKIKGIYPNTKLTDYTYSDSPRKTTRVSYRNPNHQSNNEITEDTPEWRWYTALDYIRSRLGPDIYYLVGNFCMAVYDAVMFDDYEGIEELESSLTK